MAGLKPPTVFGAISRDARKKGLGAGWGDAAKRSASEPQPAPKPFAHRTPENKNATEVAFFK
jgi:hypothetical protein